MTRKWPPLWDSLAHLISPRLAAVDMHTARHIVENCFVGDLAKGRTIILVTHHVSACLKTAHKLVEMANGRVMREGTIADLQNSGQLKTVIETEDDTKEAESGQPKQNEADAAATPSADVDKKIDEGNTKRPSWQKEPSSKGKLIEEEFRAVGRVTFNSYLTYIRAAGWRLWIPILVLMVFLRFVELATNVSSCYFSQQSFLCSRVPFSFT